MHAEKVRKILIRGPNWVGDSVLAIPAMKAVRARFPDVHFTGPRTGEELAATYAAADLFVFPTAAPYESFGLVLVEAMAWRLPIVASRWRGNFDVLTPQAGAVGFTVSL